MTPDSGLDGKTSWDKSLLRNTRCPFLRAAASAGELDIVNGHNLQSKAVLVATVDSVRKAGKGLGSVLAFFARFNHTRGLNPGADTPLQRLTQTQTEFNMDQSTDQNISDGTHNGSVDIIHGPTGSFNPEVVAEIRKIAGPSTALTPETMAQVIVAANHAAFSKVSGNSKGTVLDLAKSAGEWGLMFCLLQDDHGNVLIDDLEKLCKDAVVPPQGQGNLAKSSTREWIQYTAVITAHIAHAQNDASAGDEVAGSMHTLWCEQNDGPGCGCAACTQGKPGFWDNPGPSIRNAMATFGGGLSGWFKFH